MFQASLIVASAFNCMIFKHNMSILSFYYFYSTMAAHHPLDETRQPTGKLMPQMDDMVQTCVSRFISTIEHTFRQYMRYFHESTRNEQTIPPLKITAPNTTRSDSNNLLSNVLTTQSPHNSSFITNLTLGVDERVRSKVHVGEFVKFSSLLPKERQS